MIFCSFDCSVFSKLLGNGYHYCEERNFCLTHQEIEINDTIQSKDAAKSTSFISYGINIMEVKSKIVLDLSSQYL